MGLFISFFQGPKTAGPYLNPTLISLEPSFSQNGEESIKQKAVFQTGSGVRRRVA